LPDQLARGRWLHWLRLAGPLVRSGHMGRAQTLAASVGPFRSASGLAWGQPDPARPRRQRPPASAPSAPRASRRSAWRRRRGRGAWTSRAGRGAMRSRCGSGPCAASTRANFNKGILAGWGIDQRDPTADLRLVEYCLAIPAEHHLEGGMTRALARRAFTDRVPAEVLNERRRGRQGPTGTSVAADRDRVTRNSAGSKACAPADRCSIWTPAGLGRRLATLGLDSPAVTGAYRMALLRSLAGGPFPAPASGSNPVGR